MSALSVDIWSDIACPWCYVGKRRFESALAAFPRRDAVSVVWHSFELDPNAPRRPAAPLSYAERLATKYGTGVAQAEERIRSMAQTAREDGLDLRFDCVKPTNTFDAHRLLHFAHEHGLQDAAKERLLRAYFTDGTLLGDPAELVRLGTEVGLDGSALVRLFAGDAYTTDVRADEDKARSLGIRGVPFFVIGGRYAVSGAQPAAALLGVLQQACDELPETEAAAASEGAACGPAGCA
ncbi:MAG TPA: DsbA family oxidoreductase [Polyangiaceae bacterium]|nr:DsbA family oxidoreductase [Polyangiaceae bacterium]